MRERMAYAGRQRGAARGGARTMARWLWATTLFAALAVDAWRPPQQPLIVPISHSRVPRHARNTIHHLHILGWHLELQENRAIRSPYYNQCQFYKGRVLYEEESTVTVTECEGQLYGLLQVGGEDFVLQPTKPDGGHVLRRRDVLQAEQPIAYNLTGDMVNEFDIDFDEDEVVPAIHVRPRHTDHSDIEYHRNGLRTYTRPVSGAKGLWLELAIVADHTMLKFHGRERVKHYILAIMNIVSAIFNDQSLGSNMTLVINKLFMYEEKDPVIKYGNVKKSLEAVNKWNYRHLMKLPTGLLLKIYFDAPCLSERLYPELEKQILPRKSQRKAQKLLFSNINNSPYNVHLDDLKQPCPYTCRYSRKQFKYKHYFCNPQRKNDLCLCCVASYFPNGWTDFDFVVSFQR